MKRVLVTGVGGFVGARAAEYFGKKHTLITMLKGMARAADEEAVRAFIAESHPELIVHTAAISEIPDCERDPEASYRANVCLPVWIAKAAAPLGAKLLCFSSDQVYTGLDPRGVFEETQVCHPTNVYGRHKLEMEQRVLDILPDSVMLRATWMYDFPGYGLPIHGNLLVNLLAAAAKGETARFSKADMRGITYVRQVAELLEKTAEIPGGVYNYGSENPLNMYDTAKDFADTLGIRLDLQESDDRAPRSLAFSNRKLRGQGVAFDDTQTGIRRCVREYALKGFLC